jgi:hypothetical protein
MLETIVLTVATAVIVVLYHKVKQWDDSHLQPSYRRR